MNLNKLEKKFFMWCENETKDNNEKYPLNSIIHFFVKNNFTTFGFHRDHPQAWESITKEAQPDETSSLE